LKPIAIKQDASDDLYSNGMASLVMVY